MISFNSSECFFLYNTSYCWLAFLGDKLQPVVFSLSYSLKRLAEIRNIIEHEKCSTGQENKQDKCKPGFVLIALNIRKQQFNKLTIIKTIMQKAISILFQQKLPFFHLPKHFMSRPFLINNIDVLNINCYLCVFIRCDVLVYYRPKV